MDNQYYFQILIEDVSELREFLGEIASFSFDIDWNHTTGICTVIFNSIQEFEIVMSNLDFEVLTED